MDDNEFKRFFPNDPLQVGWGYGNDIATACSIGKSLDREIRLGEYDDNKFRCAGRKLISINQMTIRILTWIVKNHVNDG